ncbi:MAG TPA: hypothetical protein PLW61_06100 [Caldisericia bacterium]|nr:hypothetical protein [Caldisericia bacterium]
MKKEEIKSRIDELSEKIEKKKLKGFAVKKAKDEIENLEIELSELEEAEITDDEYAGGDVPEESDEPYVGLSDHDKDDVDFGTMTFTKKEYLEEVNEPEEVEEKSYEIKEVKKERTEDILEGFKNKIEKFKNETVEVKQEPKKVVKVEPKKVEELPDVEVAPAGKKKYKFVYHTPNGELMALHFRKGKRELVRYGKLLWLTDDEYSCFPQWFKPVK